MVMNIPVDYLSRNDIQRAVATLKRSLTRQGIDNVISIGLGIGIVSGNYDPDRSLCAKFYVPRKLKKPGSRRIREEEYISIDVPQPDGSFQRKRIEIKTDVVTQGKFVQTGAEVLARSRNGSTEESTAGAVISWNSASLKRWGLLGVEHSVIDAEFSEVQINTGTEDINANVLSRSELPQSRIDASVIGISSRAELNRIPSLSITSGADFIPPVSGDELVANDLSQFLGKTYPAGKALAYFTLQTFFRLFKPTSTSTGYYDVIEGWSSTPNAFAPGTSGSVWTIDDKPAAIQIGAIAPDFTTGYAQLLETSLKWAKERIGSSTLGLVKSF